MLTPNLQLVKRTDNILYETHEFLKTISGATVLFTVRKNLNDAAATFSAEVTVDYATGAFTVPVSASNTDIDTGVYYYDIVATKDGKRYLIAAGKLEIIASASSVSST